MSKDKDILACEGSCDGGCRGEVIPVKCVHPEDTNPWFFNYCEKAIEVDRSRGFVVEVEAAVTKSKKGYLGDGVYADVDNGMIKLTTEDGIETTNTIFLEYEVFAALQVYVEKLMRKTS
jgi:hypothetical protein